MEPFLRLRHPAAAPLAAHKPTSQPDDDINADTPQSVTLLSLPPEIHNMIHRQLIYPDALSLKHTNRYFYRTVDTGVKLKVEWLMERRMLHLECPNNTRCDLGSDLRFCRGSVASVIPLIPSLDAKQLI
jgi:hypothetical protein